MLMSRWKADRQFGERLPADEPGICRDVLHRDRDHRQLLVEHALGQFGDLVDGLARELGIGFAREMNDDVGHGDFLGNGEREVIVETARPSEKQEDMMQSICFTNG